MATIIEMKEERAALFEDVQALAAKAEAQKRDFTPNEQLVWHQKNSSIDRLTADIPAAELSERAAVLRASTEYGVRPPGSTRGANRAGEWLDSELRALVGSGTTGGGAYTPAEASKDFFDLLAAASVALRAGFKQIRTDKDSLIVPRLTADTGASWTAEAAPITQTSLAADQVTATPRKLAGLERLSNELINDSVPAILDIAARSLVRSISLKLDLGILEGSGTAPEIRGLKNTSGIQTVSMGTNGLVPINLDPFADAIGALEASNAEATACIMHPRTWKTLQKIKETSTSVKPVLTDGSGSPTGGIERSIYGTPVFLSSQIAITEVQGTSGAVASSAYVVTADQCVAVMREDVRVERDASRLFNSDESEVRAILRADFVAAQPSAVVRILGILA